MRGRRWTGLAATGALALVLVGCATITYEAELVDGLIALNRVGDPDGYERVGAFSEERRSVFLVAQLITVVDAELDDAATRALARSDGDAIINLRIHEEYDAIDVVVAILAGGLVDTRSVTLEGDIVRWTGGADDGLAGALAAHCRAVDVPAAGGGIRTGHVCLGR